MTVNEKYKIFFEYRYLIDSDLQKYSPDKYDIEELYDAGIAGLFRAIDEMNVSSDDFNQYTLFYIKNAINKRINNEG
jgi:DNA-directed RNA polymerase specialized sigma subunit